MITEAQRRALFALREALHLCDDALIMLSLNDDGPGMAIEALDQRVVLAEIGVYLTRDDVTAVLDEHPEQ